MKFCFTVDWEDWYHGLDIPRDQWHLLERRIKIGHYKLLEILSKHKVKATYFLLGQVLEEFPELVAEIRGGLYAATGFVARAHPGCRQCSGLCAHYAFARGPGSA